MLIKYSGGRLEYKQGNFSEVSARAQGFDKRNGASEKCKGTENWYSAGVTVRHYHPTRIKRLDAAIAGRASHMTSFPWGKKTVDFGCTELIKSCPSPAASCRGGFPHLCPRRWFRDQRGKRDFSPGCEEDPSAFPAAAPPRPLQGDC